jgi:hypothetical protein
MTAFHDDPKFTRWLAALTLHDELIVMLALRDRIRDPGVGPQWSPRIKAIENRMTPDEYEEALANVERVARELDRTTPANDQ